MEKIKEYRVRISEDSYNFLNNLYNQTKIPKSKLLDIFINDIEKNLSDFLPEANSKKDTVIKINISESEKIFLQEQAKKSGASSLSSEIKYRLLNTIYKNKYFTNNEMKELINLKYELSMIGRNLNQFVRRLHLNNSVEASTKSAIELIPNIILNMKKIQGEVQNIIKFTEKRR